MLENFLNHGARGVLMLVGLAGLLLLATVMVTRRAFLPAVLFSLQTLGNALTRGLTAAEPRLISGLYLLICVLQHLREDVAARRARKAVAA
ncbi:hypothetical protein E1181_25620 [Saccharopolyspora terrae]|uniref:Uncharacterized protein n=1 Tax=Saccharopolyspora terrae TaxID=2530384 RepID=A0A4V2Y9V0_9PSEU|nr:hypothetical protein [Saccharopolyspora terrae]TDD01286.1 hypothetical protein E1181_25620 [Saccharopolyspora terrae]